MALVIGIILGLVAMNRGWGNWVFLPIGINFVLYMGCSMLLLTPADITETRDNPFATLWAASNDFGLLNVLTILVLAIMAIAGRKRN